MPRGALPPTCRARAWTSKAIVRIRHLTRSGRRVADYLDQCLCGARPRQPATFGGEGAREGVGFVNGRSRASWLTCRWRWQRTGRGRRSGSWPLRSSRETGPGTSRGRSGALESWCQGSRFRVPEVFPRLVHVADPRRRRLRPALGARRGQAPLHHPREGESRRRDGRPRPHAPIRRCPGDAAGVHPGRRSRREAGRQASRRRAAGSIPTARPASRISPSRRSPYPSSGRATAHRPERRRTSGVNVVHVFEVGMPLGRSRSNGSC